jgi:endonuclease/exonuclease/phosphatase (EEP) superfamily protein YafD
MSRLPVLSAVPLDLAGNSMIRMDVEVGGQRVRIYNVHTVAPVFGPSVGLRNHQLDRLGELVRRESGPTVVAGDFNANRWNPSFARLLDAGVRDAHDERGRGLTRTWRNGRRYPPLVLIDHVLFSRGIAAVSVRTGRGHGSDHRPVFADLAILGLPPDNRGA